LGGISQHRSETECLAFIDGRFRSGDFLYHLGRDLDDRLIGVGGGLDLRLEGWCGNAEVQGKILENARVRVGREGRDRSGSRTVHRGHLASRVHRGHDVEDAALLELLG
jgi:hypothetical protein